MPVLLAVAAVVALQSHTRIRTFPALLVAGPMGFGERGDFDDATRGPAQVQF